MVNVRAASMSQLLTNQFLLEQKKEDLRLQRRREESTLRPLPPWPTLQQIKNWRREKRREAENFERRRLRARPPVFQYFVTPPSEDEQDVQETLIVSGGVNGQQPANEPEEEFLPELLPMRLPTHEEPMEKQRAWEENKQRQPEAMDEERQRTRDRVEVDRIRRRYGLLSFEEEMQLLECYRRIEDMPPLGDILRLLSLDIGGQ
ncbi:Hypothetical predicted protein [Cloeon dipterum]|uniref:Uncharacterized protein n=1 Tax=Cloeon dipterum TaxID=197152 RepID=A0A8S1CVK8_9INSE|nr:Hypothetical predicted protein [Cloeon dipterum]